MPKPEILGAVKEYLEDHDITVGWRYRYDDQIWLAIPCDPREIEIALLHPTILFVCLFDPRSSHSTYPTNRWSSGDIDLVHPESLDQLVSLVLRIAQLSSCNPT